MNRSALAALTAAGLMFGVTVPLSKLALGWLDPTWLAVVRFGLAAPVLALVARHALRDAATLPVAAWGALGYGAMVVLQNLGVEQTSVTQLTALPAPLPVGPPTPEQAIALGALVSVGSLIPFALYAYGQARVHAELAGAFVNLEPVVGVAAGVLAFGNPFGVPQALGAILVIAGLGLSAGASGRRDRASSRSRGPSSASASPRTA
jgi:drug/metabolite transporter (DMT)-like permease